MANEVSLASAEILRFYDEPTLIVRQSGEIIAANELFVDVLGLSSAQLRGRQLSELAPDAADVAARLAQVGRSTSLTPTSLTLRSAKGDPVGFRCKGARLSSLRDSALILKLILKTEANVRFIALNETIQKLTSEVMRRRLIEHELQDADRRKDEFLAMLAHELRSPLAPITTAIHLVRSRAADRDDLARPIEILARQAQHLSKLVDDLLEVSRITRGKIRLEKRLLDTAVAVGRAVEVSRPSIDAKKQDLSVTLPHEPVWIDADPIRLAQALGNILNNASKFTGEGGRVWFSVEREGAVALFRIRDNGIGISKELMPRLFELFSQADTSLDRTQGGLGIGLTLARGLVELHGGTIEARSDGPGMGTELKLRFPIAAGPSRPAAAEALGPPLATGRCRMVVVDDNVDGAETLADVLADLGHEVAVAHDGRAALELVRAHRPKVVLLDIGLPKLNGYQVAKELRREHGRTLALVAVTGYGQQEDRRRTEEAGFDHHLVKPVDLDAFMRLMAELTASAR